MVVIIAIAVAVLVAALLSRRPRPGAKGDRPVTVADLRQVIPRGPDAIRPARYPARRRIVRRG